MKNKSIFLAIAFLLCGQNAHGMRKVNSKFTKLKTGVIAALTAKMSGLIGFMNTAAPTAVAQATTVNTVTGTSAINTILPMVHANATMITDVVQTTAQVPNLWPCVDPAFTALNSAAQQFAPSMFTAMVAPSATTMAATSIAGVGLPMATVAAYAAFLAKQIHEVKKEQRLLGQTPENIYQLSALHDQMLALTAGDGNGNGNHNSNGSGGNDSEQQGNNSSWKKTKHGATIAAGLFAAGNGIYRILPEKDKHEPVDEKAFERLIDFMLTKKNFGENKDQFNFDESAPDRSETETGNYMKKITRKTERQIKDEKWSMYREAQMAFLLGKSSYEPVQQNFDDYYQDKINTKNSADVDQIQATFSSHERTSPPLKPTEIQYIYYKNFKALEEVQKIQRALWGVSKEQELNEQNDSMLPLNEFPNDNIFNKTKNLLSAKRNQATQGLSQDGQFYPAQKKFTPLFEISTDKYGTYRCTDTLAAKENDWRNTSCYPVELFESKSRYPGSKESIPRYDQPTQMDRMADLTQN